MAIVYTGGTFDLFHSGHVNLLKKCKEVAGVDGKVIVSLNADEFIKEYKGKPPVCSDAERKAVLLACKYVDDGKAEGIVVSDTQINNRKQEIFKPLKHYKTYRNAIVAGSVNPHYINPKQGLERLQKLMDEYCGGVTVSYMTNENLLSICLKKLKIMEEDLESLAAEDLHELLRAWELKHRHRTAECVTQHTLFRKETRWPGYYYRGDVMKLDDENWHVLTVSRRDPKTGEYTMEKAPCYHLVGEEETA